MGFVTALAADVAAVRFGKLGGIATLHLDSVLVLATCM